MPFSQSPQYISDRQNGGYHTEVYGRVRNVTSHAMVYRIYHMHQVVDPLRKADVILRLRYLQVCDTQGRTTGRLVLPAGSVDSDLHCGGDILS